MRSFYSEAADKAISHPSLKTAAGSEQFVLHFADHRFATENEALADALAALVDAGALPGVREVKAQKGKAAPDGADGK